MIKVSIEVNSMKKMITSLFLTLGKGVMLLTYFASFLLCSLFAFSSRNIYSIKNQIRNRYTCFLNKAEKVLK